tara:strand:- start:1914 stop:3032 length:1119 start_codon:yes stop_codon:yes gene_type:complete
MTDIEQKKRKVALITGITGQDGSYLAEFLLRKNYIVHGIIRRASNFNTKRIDHIYKDRHEKNCNLFLHYGDLTDSSNIQIIISKTKPTEIYNLAAQSHVQVSFEQPEYTGDVDALGTLRILNAVRAAELYNCKIYQACTSELYGEVLESPQNELTPFNPRSPYAVAKQYAFWICKNFRDAYGMFICNGILFNHESPRRGPTFVTKKITRAVANIIFKRQDRVFLGNLNAKRDWGHAKDYIEAMWLMLNAEKAEDYVCATNIMHTVREFVEAAFKCVGIIIEWNGKGQYEKGIIKDIESIQNLPKVDLPLGKEVVFIDPRYYRPCEVEKLCGDYSKIKKELGWEPKQTFEQIVEEMVFADIDSVYKTLKHTIS